MDSLASSLRDLDFEDDTEDEEEESEDEVSSFRFFDLPAELRFKILGYIYKMSKIIDVDVRATRLLSTFFVSKQYYMEAAQSFYGTNTFRLLPTVGHAMQKKVQPLISFLPTSARVRLTSLEFRLGPFWTKPPASWKIDRSLGLEDALCVRILKVFIEVDPSHAVFTGFRGAGIFYTEFAANLLREIIKRLPAIQGIEVDAYPSVKPELALLPRITQVALECGLHIWYAPGLRASRPQAQASSIELQRGMVPFYSTSLSRP